MQRKLLAVGCACLLAVTALTGCGRGEPDPKEEGGMLTLATQDAYYLQNAMRPEAQKKTQKAAQPAAAKAA